MSAKPAGTQGAPAESPARILIVDDEPRIRTLHARLAESLGYESELAADGVEALA
jgi:CheY-like chemotaxis protein